jgi:integrase
MTAELSAKAITFKPPGYFRVAPNLYLEKKSKVGERVLRGNWTLSYVSPKLGKRVWMGLGTAPDINVSDAKLQATEHRIVIAKGGCPLSLRRAAQADRKPVRLSFRSFKDAARDYVIAHQAGWKSAKHAQQWHRTLETYAYPTLAALPVEKIGVAEVLEVLRPVWTEKTETANRLRGRIELVLDFARAQGWRSGDNPARWKGLLDNLLPAKTKIAPVEHLAALPWQQLPDLYGQLTALGDDDMAALALRYLILTGLRVGEALFTPAEGEIDLDAHVHVVPRERMKAAKPHRVPLSEEAMTVLNAAAAGRTGPYWFSGHHQGRALGKSAPRLKLLDLVEGATVHGMRSSLRDWMAEHGVNSEVAELVLAHTIKDKVEAAYRRGDLLEPRRRVMEAWASFLLTGEPASNVVPLDEKEAARRQAG